MNTVLKKSDSWGAMASSLCLAHCLATPFLFIAQASAVCCHNNVPIWWHSIDFIFLAVSFFAIYRSTKTSTNTIVKNGFWIFWGLLCLLIFNEKLEWFPLPETVMHLTAIALIILHIYNLKFCQCKNNACCSNPNLKD